MRGTGIMLGVRYLFRWSGAFTLFALVAATVLARGAPSSEPTVEELKARLSSTGIGARPPLWVNIAKKKLGEPEKLYAASEMERGKAALTDVVAFSELARDYAIQ